MTDEKAGPFTFDDADRRSRANLKAREEARAERTGTPSMWREGVSGAPDGVWPGKQVGKMGRHGPVDPRIGIATHAVSVVEGVKRGDWYIDAEPELPDTLVMIGGVTLRTTRIGRVLDEGTIDDEPVIVRG